jgi:trehalose 6-phosphate synthase/phosphatase
VATDWLAEAERRLDAIRARTPGALVERKTTSLVWHYRMVEPPLAALRLREAIEALGDVVRQAPVEFMEGKMALEVRPLGVSKALVVRRIVEAAGGQLTLAAIGDDCTDEDMFAALPAGSVAIHVGGGPSTAPYRLPDVDAVRRFVARVAGVEPAPASGRA